MTHAKILKLPITNVYAKGDFTAELFIGSEKQSVNLILDTGSSTLVIEPPAYQPEFDKSLTATTLAQEVNYGIGGWDGPVVLTNITIGQNEQQLTLKQSHVAVVKNEKQNTFGAADGILGLAYHHLNKGFDLSQYLTKNEISPALTYPWPFTEAHKQKLVDANDLPSFKHFLWQQPEQDITPYFTELEEHGLVANKFAFYSSRSSIYATAENASIAELKQAPKNQGFIVLGGGEEQTECYQGEFQSIEISHDIYYNAQLVSVQVASNAEIVAAPLEKSHEKAYCTNAIIDTGASALVLTNPIFTEMVTQLTAINPEFETLIKAFSDISAQATGIDASLINLTEWPDIKFNFIGEKQIGENKETITLVCPPSCYWQLNAPTPTKACFKILSQLPQWPNQSIIGLPLLNNYYLIFDRSEDKTGVVKFAKQVPLSTNIE